VTAHLHIVTIPPDQRSQRIAEAQAVLADLREHPIDCEPYVEELRAVERELRELLAAEG
jgi:hypothetical protein